MADHAKDHTLPEILAQRQAARRTLEENLKPHKDLVVLARQAFTWQKPVLTGVLFGAYHTIIFLHIFSGLGLVPSIAFSLLAYNLVKTVLYYSKLNVASHLEKLDKKGPTLNEKEKEQEFSEACSKMVEVQCFFHTVKEQLAKKQSADPAHISSVVEACGFWFMIGFFTSHLDGPFALYLITLTLLALPGLKYNGYLDNAQKKGKELFDQAMKHAVELSKQVGPKINAVLGKNKKQQ